MTKQQAKNLKTLDRVICNKSISFTDGTNHENGQTLMVGPRELDYYKINYLNYDIPENKLEKYHAKKKTIQLTFREANILMGIMGCMELGMAQEYCNLSMRGRLVEKLTGDEYHDLFSKLNNNFPEPPIE